MNLLLKNILFPKRPATYSERSLEGLFYVPKHFGSASIKNLEEAKDYYNNRNAEKQQLIPCLYIAAPKTSSNIIVYFHANGCDLGDIQQELEILTQYCNCHIVAFEYPGYGISREKKCDIKSINQYAESVIKLLLLFVKNSKQIFLMGRSIGTGPATEMMKVFQKKQITLGGLILHSPFLSIKDLINDYVPNPFSILSEAGWNTQKNMEEFGEVPLLIQHSKCDEVINVSHTNKLFKNRVNKKSTHLCISTTSTHNNYDVYTDLCKPIKLFLETYGLNDEVFVRNLVFLFELSDDLIFQDIPENLFTYIRRELLCGCRMD